MSEKWKANELKMKKINKIKLVFVYKIQPSKSMKNYF